MLDLAKQWADNKVDVYQVINEAEKIVKAAVLRGITAQQMPQPRINMKFRKKPVVIEAVQFTEAVRDAALFDGQPLPDGVRRGASTLHPPTRKVWSASFFIETLEGRMEVSVGDWVITGIKGERYPCKPDIFAATYEPA